MQLCAADMQPGSSILNISSVSGSPPSRTSIPNCTSKAALNMATQVAALELGPKGIRCKSIAPGMMDVESNAGGDIEAAARANPMGRIGEGMDVASLALFLSSDEASWINGVVVPCDG